MRTAMPKCAYKAKDCPGSSDAAYEYFDEQVWELFQWMCPRCQDEYRIANDMPFDDEEDLAA